MRRIEAIAGRSIPASIRELIVNIRAQDEEKAVLQDRLKAAEREIASMRTSTLKDTIPAIAAAAVTVDGIRVAAATVEAATTDQLKELGDTLRAELKSSGVGILATIIDDKVQLVCVTTDDLLKLKPAGKLVGLAAAMVGGAGGGKPHLATAGGKDAAGVSSMLAEFPKLVSSYTF